MADTDSFLKQHGQKIAILFFWGVVVVAYFVYSTRQGLGPLEVVNQVVQVLQTSAWGPLLYILLYTLRPILLFSAALLTVAGGLLFGPIWGWLYATIGANSGAMVAYGLGRVLGKGALENSQSDSFFQKYADRMRENAFDTVLTMRFLFLPYDLVNYLAGFLRIDWRAFLLASFLGSLPGSIAFILFGASLEGSIIEGTPSLNPWTLAASVAIFIVSIVLSRVFKRRETNQA
jgi:uncharacterized membrane protein YdjX (TVP38/TMEM64 family)